MTKKYITTEKHPELKEGILLDSSGNNSQYYAFSLTDDIDNHHIEEFIIKSWLNKGYIKELQEPKWTDDDMIGFYYFAMEQSGAISLVDILKSFENRKQ